MAKMRRVASKAPLRWGECRHSGRCIVTGCDARHEWMLPWWHENARRHSGLPVVFVDFGLSPRGLAWCRARGEVVREVPGAFDPIQAGVLNGVPAPGPVSPRHTGSWKGRDVSFPAKCRVVSGDIGRI